MSELEKDFVGEQEKMVAITSDMTRQYKQMQDALLKDMKALKQTSSEKDNILSIIFLIIYSSNNVFF